ncbi:SARP family transcriptional regulator [Paracoccus luteus]|uniref:SARP family transcriptional regulator n=1 Tax=Paracoccus luteus TaxID=2508543 RepID=UPI00106F3668|nr:SARP family transcriptional regulator [Paracoccus luteus]
MQLTLRLMGPVTLSTGDGADVTPRGPRMRAVLALLGTGPDMRLPRARIQDRLWSVRPQRQGSDSLRRLLSDLRTALGAHAGVLVAGDGWLGLDPARVAVDLRPVVGPDGAPAEFAAGLDIPDPEFEDWLRDMRLAMEDRPAPPPPLLLPAPLPPQLSPSLPAAIGDARPALVVVEPQCSDDEARAIAGIVLNDAAARAAELIPARLLAPPAPPGAKGLSAQALCMASGPEITLMVVLRDLGSGAQLWAQRYPIRRDNAAASTRSATAAIALTMIQTAAQSLDAAQPVFPLADLFSFARDRLLSADDRLAESQPLGNSALGLSMRSWLRYTLIIERQTGDPAARLAEAEQFTARARQMAPVDPTVLAVAAMLRSWRGDVAGALDLARMACRIAPEHDLARHVLSQALTDAGRHAEALAMAVKSANGPMAMVGKASWLLRRAVAQIRLGRFAEAERLAAAALAHAPDNRPSLRFLAALRHHRGDEAGAAAALADLRRLEPDFTLQLMADPDYPVSTLRSAGLIGITRSGL